MTAVINDNILTENEAAAVLKLQGSTLRVWRSLRKGPRYLSLAGNIRYRLQDLINWLERQVVDPTPKRGRGRPRKDGQAPKRRKAGPGRPRTTPLETQDAQV